MEQDRQRKASVFGLVREAMPRVVELVAEERKRRGDAFVAECQRRGMAGEPGFFYAWEGGVAVGTPWPEAMALIAQVDPKGAYPTKAVVMFPAQVG